MEEAQKASWDADLIKWHPRLFLLASLESVAWPNMRCPRRAELLTSDRAFLLPSHSALSARRSHPECC
eukprot:2678741-Rhodomonas_salina.1